MANGMYIRRSICVLSVDGKHQARCVNCIGNGSVARRLTRHTSALSYRRWPDDRCTAITESKCEF